MSWSLSFEGNVTERNINISGTFPHGVTVLSGIVCMSRSQNFFSRGSTNRLLISLDKKSDFGPIQAILDKTVIPTSSVFVNL